jgi:replication factor A1
MTTERIIEQILSEHPEIPREELLERLEKEKRKTGSLISDESLLRMIAAEFGVEIPTESSAPAPSIEILVPGLSDVAVAGRVIAVFPSRTFKKNRTGKFADLLIADKSGILRVILWNDKASVIESAELKVGQIIRFSHGYTRGDRSGKVEFHIGEKGKIEINPQDLEAKNYPTVSKFTTKIGEITPAYKNKKMNITGTVKELSSVSNFKRQDTSSGKVMRFVLVDETGEISVVAWNEKVDELEKMLKKGVGLQMVNAKVKKAMSHGLEIHVDRETYVAAIAPAEDCLKIANLEEGLSYVNVEGEIVTKPMFRDVKTSKEDLVELAMFELKDETGRIWVSAWRKHADSVRDLKVGDRIIVKNAYVKKGFGDQLELSTRNVTSIVKKGSEDQN